MTTEQTKEVPAPLPGSEGLKPFTWNGANKFDLQTANDLFEELSKDPKNPQILGKINALKLDVMKRAAEAEISKLEPKTTRIQIEAEMKNKEVSKEQANDELAYVLVTYLQNVEKLAKERQAAKASVTVEAKDSAAKLKTELPPVAAKAETVVPDAKTAKPAADTVVKEPKPRTIEGEKKETLSPEELKNAKFIKEHRAEIDSLVKKLPDEKAKSTLSGLLDKPTRNNVITIQTEIGLKEGEKNGADGQFGRITLTALKAYANERAENKREIDALLGKSPPPNLKPIESGADFTKLKSGDVVEIVYDGAKKLTVPFHSVMDGKVYFGSTVGFNPKYLTEVSRVISITKVPSSNEEKKRGEEKAAAETKPAQAAETRTYTPDGLAAAASSQGNQSIKDVTPMGRATPRTEPPLRLAEKDAPIFPTGKKDV